MDSYHIEVATIYDAWCFCLKEILNRGYKYKVDVGNFKGQFRKELDFITIHIKFDSNNNLKKCDYAEGYLADDLCEGKLNKNNHSYMRYLESQIAIVIKNYKQCGYNNNQLIMMIGDEKTIQLDDPPCLRLIDTRIRDNKLHFIAYFRSWDLWAGFFADLMSLCNLKNYMADAINVNTGDLIVCSKGLHLYDYSWDVAKNIILLLERHYFI